MEWARCNCNDLPGGGCDCLLKGTAITMADGTTKPVELIERGDKVLAFDEAGRSFVSSEVLSVHAPYSVGHYFIINDKIRTTENHPVLRNGQWVSTGSLAAGDRLFAADGSEATVFAIRRVDADVTVYNFQVAAGTYVAEGGVVHNKEDCQEYTQYRPDDGHSN